MLEIIDCQIETKTWRITLPNIQVHKGELLVITGPSGIGKSTLLHWLLGNIPQHVVMKGKIILSGNNLTELPIEQRRVGLLMQDVYLFPHLNVLDNICFALPKTPLRSSKKQRRAAAMDLLAQINLTHLASRYPQNLSGGERSRVGLIRALANQPQVMLLDEPFAALDPSTREKMGTWAFQQLAEQNIPSVMVSHDVEDIPDAAQQLCLADYYQTLEQK
ncbi:ATP-binding cassette domain-containing protein [uncultured Paraglaciecola sp.]|uniref:ATP-binding cassette domain-containing protein n=1 Tax=uncultured Paraglaciecola sp. TaxID=1765024 RepID=UPI0030DCE22C